ncbi:hypothetical protein AB5V95_00445 [Metamycoplasma spumans]|uniref:hypothetical protein n=1 Tax=Metamycoplasma spumans TaxID=92406 RepID=UPI0034DDB60C
MLLEDKPYIIGIAIGLSVLFILILVFSIAMLKLMNKNKKNFIQKALVDQSVSEQILKISKEMENAEVISKNKYRFDKYIDFEINDILISKKSIYLINNIYITEGKILGSVKDKYLDIKINEEKYKKYQNPFLKGKKLIKKIHRVFNKETPIKLIYVINNSVELQIEGIFEDIYMIKEDQIRDFIFDLEDKIEHDYLKQKIGNVSSVFKQYIK